MILEIAISEHPDRRAFSAHQKHEFIDIDLLLLAGTILDIFLTKTKLVPKFKSILSPDGEIGRHARFRFWYRKVCRFESYSGHISGDIFRKEDVSVFFFF